MIYGHTHNVVDGCWTIDLYQPLLVVFVVKHLQNIGKNDAEAVLKLTLP